MLEINETFSKVALGTPQTAKSSFCDSMRVNTAIHNTGENRTCNDLPINPEEERKPFFAFKVLILRGRMKMNPTTMLPNVAKLILRRDIADRKTIPGKILAAPNVDKNRSEVAEATLDLIREVKTERNVIRSRADANHRAVTYDNSERRPGKQHTK